MISDSALAREFWERGRVPSCPVYDMHGHMGAFRGIYFPRSQPGRMIHTMDGAGVRMLLFSHHDRLFIPEADPATGADAVRRWPDRFRIYLLVNPHYPPASEQIEEIFAAHPATFVGFKFLPDYHKQPLTAEGYRLMAENFERVVFSRIVL